MLIYSSSGNMSQQVTLKKVDFLTTTQYEKAIIPKSERFIVRQGDLIVTNYYLEKRRIMGLTYARPRENENGIYVFRGSHIIIALKDKTILVHNEHGIVEIPQNYYDLNLYTFEQAID
jgi:hypothetical protein